MTCSWCEERFARFIDGACTPAEGSRLLAHVDTCPACRGLLEELRVVDALLIEPRDIALPADFTRSTMADVRALPLPQTQRPRVIAWLVSFIAAAWLLIGALSVLAPNNFRAIGETAVDYAHTVLMAFAGFGRVGARMFVHGDLGSWSTVAGGVVIADAFVVFAALLVLRIARPRIAERLRW